MAQIYPSLLDPFIQACVGRRDDCAKQLANGRYVRINSPLTYAHIFAHLVGEQMLGTYVINEENQCTFAVFDSDQPTGLFDLAQVQNTLAGWGIPSYLEQSRRGAHLWIFLTEPTDPAQLRSWLLPFCPRGVEFYPKQEVACFDHPGCLIRLPLGIHQRSGQRYPFVQLLDNQLVPLFSSVTLALPWFATIERVQVPVLPIVSSPSMQIETPAAIPFKKSEPFVHARGTLTIRDWCAAHDPLAIIGQYVALAENGMGCCPFGWHHDDGIDSHPSFWVYRPTPPNICCWYCHTWGAGGSLFDFLRLYYGLEAGELWHRILSGMPV